MSEVIDIVDERNEVVGQATMQQVYERRLNHRVAHVLLFNDRGEVFLVQTSAKHTYCPGHWTTSASVTLRKGETYEVAAQRALSDWLGIAVPVTRIHDAPYDHYKMRKFVQVFRAISQGPFPLNKELAASGRFFSVADVQDMVKKNQLVHPELAHVMDKLYST